MKNIMKIFKRDMKNIFTNWVATVVVIALMVIPSLYSLINIKASWDPYSNTRGISVAIINEDKGTRFKDEDINLGNELVNKLKDNDKMGWVFVDKDTAEKGLLQEKYYAAIEIPESFSADVTTLISKNVTRPKLIYTVNEKKNPIAPKLTDAGVKSIKEEIDNNIVKTVSGILFRICNEVGVNLEENRPEYREVIDDVYQLDENMPEIEKLLNSAINGTTNLSNLTQEVNKMIPTLSDTIDITDEFLQNSQGVFDKTQGELWDISPIIKDDLVRSENLLDNISTKLANLDENILPEMEKKTLLMALDTGKATSTSIDDSISQLKSIKKLIDKLSNIEIIEPQMDYTSQTQDKIDELQKEIKKQMESLKKTQESLKSISKNISKTINNLNDVNEKLDTVVNSLNNEIEKIDNGEKLDNGTITDIRKVLDEIHKSVSDMTDSYDSEIVPTVEEGFDSIKAISDSSLNVLEQSRDTLPDVEQLLSVFADGSDLSNEELFKLKDKFPEIKQKVHDLAEKFRELDNENKFDEVLDMLTNNWQNQSDFLSSPVEIQDNRLFPWPNYGSAATPFYTVLCLWIGGYMLSILLGTEAHSLEEGKELKSYEIYFGKMLLFLFIGIAQAVIASTGALFILGSYAVHPVMFVFFTIFVSMIFMIIIYTAVSVFGNAGIIFGVVLLVIQVAGTSGNFPIEVNPEIFQKIFLFLPFTYAISGMRQVMAGIVYSILFKDVSVLSVFMVISIIIGILFKKVTNKKNAKFTQKLKESTIMNG